MLLLSVSLGCSGDDSATGDAGSDAPSDSTVTDSGGNDAAPDAVADVKNDSTTIVDASSDAGIACTDPSACGAGTPVCCATILTGPGNAPACPVESVSAGCATSASCATAFAFTCAASETVRFCKTNADCTEATYDKCCTFAGDAGDASALTFCANTGIAAAGGGTCL